MDASILAGTLSELHGNPQVFLAVSVPIPMAGLTQVFWLEQALDHPKQSSIEWVMSKTIKLIINPSILDDPGLISKLMSAGIHTHTMYPGKKPAQSPWVYAYLCNTLGTAAHFTLAGELNRPLLLCFKLGGKTISTHQAWLCKTGAPWSGQARIDLAGMYRGLPHSSFRIHPLYYLYQHCLFLGYL